MHYEENKNRANTPTEEARKQNGEPSSVTALVHQPMEIEHAETGEEDSEAAMSEYLKKCKERWNTERHEPKFILEIIVAAILLIYTIFTVLMYFANRDAANAAKSAADAAGQTLADNRAIYRPFLVIDSTNTVNRPDEGSVTYEVLLVNASDIGASNVDISCDWFFNGTKFPDRSGRFKSKISSLGGRQKMTPCVGEITGPVVRMVLNGADLAVFVHGSYGRPGVDGTYPYCEKLQYDGRFGKFVILGGCDPSKTFPQ